MILRHNLSQFTKFILGDLKYFQRVDIVTTTFVCFICGCVQYLILVPVPILPVRSGACLSRIHFLVHTSAL